MFTNEFSVYSVLVYNRYTNANDDLWRVGIWQKYLSYNQAFQ